MVIATIRSLRAERANAMRPTRALPLSRRAPVDVAIALALTFLSALASVAAEPNAAAEIVAAQIRAQGYACTRPVTAVRDGAASRPNETVWMLTCGNARYRVRLVPDMAAHITQLK